MFLTTIERGKAMTFWQWTERQFRFDFPVTKLPDLLERIRGTPARMEERVRDVPRDLLVRRPEKGWSIQENIGHLLDLGYLPMQRIGEILSGTEVLVAADMANRKTHEADHNSKDVRDLLRAFRHDREKLVSRFEQLDPSDLEKAALHPRLKQPLRIVDIAYFDAEHDDYHLARIGALIRKFAGA